MMKTLLLIIICLFGAFSFAGSTESQILTGTYLGSSDKFVELKTPNNILLVPKDLIKKKTFKQGEVIDLQLTKSELDRIKLKGL